MFCRRIGQMQAVHFGLRPTGTSLSLIVIKQKSTGLYRTIARYKYNISRVVNI